MRPGAVAEQLGVSRQRASVLIRDGVVSMGADGELVDNRKAPGRRRRTHAPHPTLPGALCDERRPHVANESEFWTAWELGDGCAACARALEGMKR